MRSMKKRLLFVTILLLVTGHLFAQEIESRPFAENHKLWVQEYVQYKSEYYTDGDTIIAGKNCFRVFEINKDPNGTITDQKYYGAIFDEGKKSYFISPNAETSELLFDFEVSEDDHFTINNCEMWVEKDSVIESCNRYYRRLLLHNLTNEEKNIEYGEYYYVPGFWIEGIGSNSPYFSNPSLWIGTFWFRLVECYVEGELIYRDPRYNPQVDSIESPQSVSEGKRNTLYDLSGRRVSVSSVPSVSSVLPKGVYIQNGKKVVMK